MFPHPTPHPPQLLMFLMRALTAGVRWNFRIASICISLMTINKAEKVGNKKIRGGGEVRERE